jgi:arylsulfatase A-like enzyme
MIGTDRAESAARAPNIVTVVMDTVRAREIVRLDRRDTTFPAIDRLAREGTEYTQAFAAAPWTLPSHASLFTGTYPSKHGAHAGHKHLDDDLPTLAEVFSANGYETVAVSNNTWISEEFGFARGFETLYKTWQYLQRDTDLGSVARTSEGRATVRALAERLTDGNPVVNAANALYGKFLRKRSDDGARRTNEWISEWLSERERSRPYFLFANYLEPHLQYDPPQEIAERFLPSGTSYDEAMAIPQDAWGYIAGEVNLDEQDFEILRALYRAEIAYLDRRIGELRRLLEAAGEWENTIFVVTSDHGENIGEHGLMDHQYSLYDTLLHVPLIISGGAVGKSAFSGGNKIDDLVQLTDLAPTLLDAAGIDAPMARTEFQGRSFHPLATTEPREFVVGEYMAPQPSMDALETRVGSLSSAISRYDRSLRAIRTEEDKLIRGSDGSREVYALSDDQAESYNISDEPERADALGAELDAWLDSFEQAEASGPVSMTDSTQRRLEDLGYLQ